MRLKHVRCNLEVGVTITMPACVDEEAFLQDLTPGETYNLEIDDA